MILTWILKIDQQPAQRIVGRQGAILDMAYDNGAMRVTLIPESRHDRASDL